MSGAADGGYQGMSPVRQQSEGSVVSTGTLAPQTMVEGSPLELQRPRSSKLPAMMSPNVPFSFSAT